jgi:hypothetical protein
MLVISAAAFRIAEKQESNHCCDRQRDAEHDDDHGLVPLKTTRLLSLTELHNTSISGV